MTASYFFQNTQLIISILSNEGDRKGHYFWLGGADILKVSRKMSYTLAHLLTFVIFCHMVTQCDKIVVGFDNNNNKMKMKITLLYSFKNRKALGTG